MAKTKNNNTNTSSSNKSKTTGSLSSSSPSPKSMNDDEYDLLQEYEDTSTAVLLLQSLVAAGLLQILYRACVEAYQIRLYAINEFGRVIHEFDPYFNYRATEYLYEHGWEKFSKWFDYLVWYPLGRPVGTTIYPGMQVTSVFLKNHVLPNWSINDICVFVPAWFGVSATLAVAMLTFVCTFGNQGSILQHIPVLAQIQYYIFRPAAEFVLKGLEKVTGSTWGLGNHNNNNNKKKSYFGQWMTSLACATFAACIMSIVPAHLLRSVGGGYDNESIAMTAMVQTFAFWAWSLRERNNHWITLMLGCITGIAYFYMVAAWGGYVFVLNLVGVHASLLVLIGRYSTKLHRAYTGFYVVGTALAIQVPVVGWTPLRSLEQMGPFVAFAGMQLIEFCEVIRRRRNLSAKKAWTLRIFVFGIAGVIGAFFILILAGRGYFGPISSRVRGLFVKHTKTGNPLVDSVAEHQAAKPEAYFQYLHDVCYIAPIGFLMTTFFFFDDSSSFLVVYVIAAYFFSHKMVRLILLTAPIASVCGGIFCGRFVSWMTSALLELVDLPLGGNVKESPPPSSSEEESAEEKTKETNKTSPEKKGKGKKNKKEQSDAADDDSKASGSNNAAGKSRRKIHPLLPVVLLVRLAVSAYLIKRAFPYMKSFHEICHQIAKQISHPTIINKAQTRDGNVILVDDYREAYHWLRDNTPEDARIMAWWDYGYQITGIANRTTLADGNTWNHEHIALLGRILTAPEKEAHRIARHLADYVLVWAGGGGDDVAKSPHLRRIANSVYRGLCAEPTCRDFGFYSDGSPTDPMQGSLLYKLHSNGIVPGVQADRNRFREVFSSKYGKVRIYKIQSVSKESKDWVANPANKQCDAPGSWFCPGQYPPALESILKSKKDFSQLEDFNRGKRDDDEYTKAYFENLLDDGKTPLKKRQKNPKGKVKKISPEEVDMINEHWENNAATSKLYELITSDKDQFDQLRAAFIEQPQLAHLRSEDGRGPMWWAHEHGKKRIVEMLKKLQVSETRTDENGISPLDISTVR